MVVVGQLLQYGAFKHGQVFALVFAGSRLQLAQQLLLALLRMNAEHAFVMGVHQPFVP